MGCGAVLEIDQTEVAPVGCGCAGYQLVFCCTVLRPYGLFEAPSSSSLVVARSGRLQFPVPGTQQRSAQPRSLGGV